MIATNLRLTQTLILDDDPVFVDLVTTILKDIGITSIYVAGSVKEAVNIFKKKPLDLLLLDIHLGDRQLTGIDFGRIVRGHTEKGIIIYLTSLFTDSNYEKAKDTLPFGFLNKDFNKLELVQAIELGLQLEANSPKQSYNLSLRNDNFYFQVGNIYKAFPKNEVLYFYAEEKSTFAKIGNRSYPISSFLKKLEYDLSHAGFIRAHKSYLINKQFVTEIHPRENKLYINEVEIPIGYVYRKNLLQEFSIFK